MALRRAIILCFLTACARGASPARAPAKDVEANGIIDPVKLLAGIPGDATLVVLAEMPGSFEKLGTFLDDAGKREMAAEMTAFIAERTGLSLEHARAGAAFLRQDDMAFVVHGVSGELKGAGPDGRASLGATAMTMAKRRDVLVVGGAKAVGAALAVLDGAPGLAVQSAKLAELLSVEAKGAVIAVGVDTESSVLEPLRPLNAMGITQGVITVRGGGLRAVLVGPEDKLKEIAKMTAGGLDVLATEMTRSKEQARLEPAPCSSCPPHELVPHGTTLSAPGLVSPGHRRQRGGVRGSRPGDGANRAAAA